MSITESVNVGGGTDRDLHCSELGGSPTWITHVTPGMSIPRAVTSDEKSTPVGSRLKFSVALVRRGCDILEWIAYTGQSNTLVIYGASELAYDQLGVVHTHHFCHQACRTRRGQKAYHLFPLFDEFGNNGHNVRVIFYNNVFLVDMLVCG